MIPKTLYFERLLVLLLIAGCAPIEEDEFGYDMGIQLIDAFDMTPLSSPPDPAGGGEESAAGESAAGESAAGEFAAPPPPDIDEDCDYIATSTDLSICLDAFTYNSDHSEANYCGLADNLAEELSNTRQDSSETDLELKVSCTDEDGDCSYVCEDWSLPEYLQDPDDQRYSIQPNVDPPDDPPAMNDSNPFEPISCLSSSDLVDSSVLSLSDEICQLNRVFDQNLMSVHSCSADMVLLLSGGMSPETPSRAQFLKLSTNTVAFREAEEPLNYTVDQLACGYSENGFHTVFYHQTEQLLSFDDNEGRIYSTLENIKNEALISMNLDLGLLSDELWIEQLNASNSGLQWFTLNMGQIGSEVPEKVLVTRFKNLGEQYHVLPNNVIDHQHLCLYCDSSRQNLRSAYLMNDLSVKLKEGDFELELFEQFGPFREIKSSDTFLALVPNEESIQNIYFSLWSNSLLSDNELNPNTLATFPLVFNASQYGYQSVELHDLKGMRALLRLTIAQESVQGPNEEELESKSEWAVYHILNDYLRVLKPNDFEESFSQLNRSATPSDTEIIWHVPLLYETWIAWHVETGESSRLFLLNLYE